MEKLARVQVCHIVLLALLAAGCGAGSISQVASVVCKSQVVTAEQGGTLVLSGEDCAALAGTRVVVPAGALAHDTAITVGMGASSIAPAGSVGVGPVVDLGPSGTHFSYGVTVTLPYTQAMVRDPYHLFVEQKEANGAVARIEHGDLEIPSSGNVLSFQVRGFTQFEAAYDTSSCSQCPPTYVCDQPSGQCVCDTGLDPCGVGDGCRDLRFDAQNCGSCGHVCAPGAACRPGSDGSGGRCVCTAPGAGTCPSDGGPQCVDLPHDPKNCGSCGNVCAIGAACSPGSDGTGGHCACIAPATGTCPSSAGAQCVDLLHDKSNCGSCGNVCVFAEACQPDDAGAHCVCVGELCPSSSGGVVCVDLSTSQYNCGSCGNVCAHNYRCRGTDGGPQCKCIHQCANPADGGLQCVDITSDPANCGRCGYACASAEVCCYDPYGCGPSCSNLATDRYNCGSCNHYCGSGEVCLNNICVHDPDAG